MKDKHKTKAQLVNELSELRKRITSLEVPEHEFTLLKGALSIVYDAIDSTVGGVIITDLKGLITYVNPSFLRVFGYKEKSELLGKNAADLFATNEVKKFTDIKAIIDVAEGVTEEFTVKRMDGSTFPVEVSSSNVKDSRGVIVGRMASLVDISKRKSAEKEKEALIKKLQNALDRIRTLRGLIPICASCKKIRDDKGYWHQVEEYIRSHSKVEFSHGICPECKERLYPGY